MANKEYDWFKFEARTWLLDFRVLTMSLECQGAYVRLMCVQWENGCIPFEPSDLALVLGFHSVDECTRFLATVWPKLKPHFPAVASSGRRGRGRQNKKLGRQRSAVMRKLEGAKAGGRIRGEQQTLAKSAAAKEQLDPSLTPADGDGDGDEDEDVHQEPPDGGHLSPGEIISSWNSLAGFHGLVPIRSMSKTRMKKYRNRVDERPDFWAVLDERLGKRDEFWRSKKLPKFQQVIAATFFENNIIDAGMEPPEEQDPQEAIDEKLRAEALGRSPS